MSADATGMIGALRPTGAMSALTSMGAAPGLGGGGVGDLVGALRLGSASTTGLAGGASGLAGLARGAGGLAGLDMSGGRATSGAMTEEDAIRKAAGEFEAFFVRTLIKEMRASIPEDGIIPKSTGEEMFQDLMDDQLSREIGGGLGLGFSDALMRQLSPANPSAPVRL